MAYRRKPLYRRVQIEQKAKDVRLTKTQMDAVVKWACLLKSGELRKESENYTNFQRYIMEDLLEYENVKHERDNVDFVVLSENGDGHALVVECKDSGTGLDQKQHRKNEAHRTPMSQLWDYMTNAKWGIVTNYRQFRLVKRSRGSNHVHEIDFLTLYDEDGPDPLPHSRVRIHVRRGSADRRRHTGHRRRHGGHGDDEPVLQAVPRHQSHDGKGV